uniref:Si:ch211-193k19.2 n=1 Tax=Nothobranchius kuhntae TaxID=321403 RepID=A0A1A8K2Z7_NOTKU
MQKSLLLDVKQRNNRKLVKHKMEKTFALRRHEVVRDAPMVESFMAKGPGPFYFIVSKKRRAARKNAQKIVAQIPDCDEPDAGRECVIKGLCVYMGEDPENLVQEYVDMDENAIKEVIQDTTIGMYVIKRSTSAEPEDIGIILEGISVLQDLENVALAAAMLIGLMYARNLNYPVDLRYTF